MAYLNLSSRFHLLFSLIFIVFISAGNVLATVYYVDARISSSGNGLTQATALKTIDDVNGLNLNPGDQVLFRKGEVWQGYDQLVIKWSGTQANPIVYGAYGNGPNPVISGARSMTKEGWNWTKSDHSGVWYIPTNQITQGISSGSGDWRMNWESTMEFLTPGGRCVNKLPVNPPIADGTVKSGSTGYCGSNSSGQWEVLFDVALMEMDEWSWGDYETPKLGYQTIYYRNGSNSQAPENIYVSQVSRVITGGNVKWIQLENLTVEMSFNGSIYFAPTIPAFQLTGFNLNNVESRWGGAGGLIIKGCDVYGHDLNISITNSSIHHNGADGFSTLGYFVNTTITPIPIRNSGLNISNSEFHNNMGDGLQVFFWDGEAGDGQKDVIEYVKAYDNGRVSGGILGGGSGLNFDGDYNTGTGVDNMIIRHCEMYRNYASGLLLEYEAKGSYIHHNLVYENGVSAMTAGITVHYAAHDNVISYNLVKDQGRPKQSGQAGGIQTTKINLNVEVKNNMIVHNTVINDKAGINQYGIKTSNEEGAIIANNIVWQSGSGNTFNQNLEVQKALKGVSLTITRMPQAI